MYIYTYTHIHIYTCMYIHTCGYGTYQTVKTRLCMAHARQSNKYGVWHIQDSQNEHSEYGPHKTARPDSQVQTLETFEGVPSWLGRGLGNLQRYMCWSMSVKDAYTSDSHSRGCSLSLSLPLFLCLCRYLSIYLKVFSPRSDAGGVRRLGEPHGGLRPFA